MLRYRVHCPGSSQVAWKLLAEPAQWSRWAPHIRGARDLGTPEVQAGRRGAVLLAGIPVPVAIVAKRPGRSWDWRVGPVEMGHAVEPLDDGCTLSITVRATAPLEAALRLGYGPMITLLLHNLARVAARASRPPTR